MIDFLEVLILKVHLTWGEIEIERRVAIDYI
jgi:hypothetical protein